MMFKTHLAFSFLVAMLFIQIVPVAYPFLFVPLVTLFGSLPDIDTTKSKIGRKLWFLSMPISVIFKHRGFFHSIFPALLLFVGLRFLGFPFLALAVAVGYCAHLLGDALTVEGVNFLHPISTFEMRGFMRTGSIVESIVFVGIIVLDVVVILRVLKLV